ncbi:hypothetical protein CDAR_497931 [Caerostris darwini]|uniref:Retinol dehydrogenase 11 n=1 Tax=Caerostris darwini TaxID=1538125 RepID=A0AAV4TFM1_9ARAC|nr:hypothetical protein CDAR_497931 [Caerostris darwini]
MSVAFCYATKDFWLRKHYHSNVKLCGKTVVITGGNTGIGREAILDLAGRGAKVVMACRDVEKGKRAAEYVRKQVQEANITVMKLDLTAFASIRSFAEELLATQPHIHYLINNAAVGACPKWKTNDGFEMQFGVNYLGHFLLTNLLLERIKASAPARIVNLGSIAHILGKIHFEDIHYERTYRSWQAYCHSKLAMVLFTRELAKRLHGTGVTTYCVDPGPCHTEIFRYIFKTHCIDSFLIRARSIFYKTAEHGAEAIVYCVVDPTIASESGYYYNNYKRVKAAKAGRKDETAKRLWDLSENLISSVQ